MLLAVTGFAEPTQHRLIIKFQCELVNSSVDWRQSALHQMYSTLSKGDEIIWVRDFLQCGGVIKVNTIKPVEQIIGDFEQLNVVQYAEVDQPMYPVQEDAGS